MNQTTNNGEEREKQMWEDPGPLPHPLAASTDISKAVRAAQGAPMLFIWQSVKHACLR